MIHGRPRSPLFSTACLTALLGSAAVPTGVSAQAGALGQDPGTGADTTLVDGIAAIVGDSVITLSEVRDGLVVAQGQGRAGITPQVVLDELINDQLVLQAASRDSTLQVSEAELDANVGQSFEVIRGRFPTQEAFAAALDSARMTPQDLRADVRETTRKEMVRDLFLRRQLQNPPTVVVTEEEMREFFEGQRAQLPRRPETLRIHQVYIEPTASDEAWAEARQRVDSLRAAITRGGADFAELAREFSADSQSAAQGGDLGWFRRGLMVREFDQVAFALPDDAVSPPVRTEFGYHLIRVERQRPGEVKARHILIRPTADEGDLTRAEARADSVAELLRSGADPRDVYDEYHGPDFVPFETYLARTDLANSPYPGYATLLADASEGDVLGPAEIEIEGTVYQAVVRVADVQEEGEYTFEDARDQIRNQLSQQKRIEAIFESLRNRSYVEIRM